ncbi:major facilitator superfamily domain-containing protein 8-like [Saccostrea cucullata]|uniref:major facilitator superfamily domain-containing protein 8-like n=1 Tax=Saccostrea cuccullata TaxID=36930 RepID=UPI002ED625A8
MSLKCKKRVTYVICGLFFLMGGIEYAVILPTLWLYMKNKFDVHPYFLGLVLSAYSFSALLFSPVIGRCSDVFRRPKLLLILCTFWEVAGNTMYFMGISKWFLLGSRLVSGLGAGGEALILAEIGRVTSEEDRTGIISSLVSMRQLGLVFGPGLNFFLRLSNFYIGPFIVNKFTAPGAFMACMWTLQCIFLIFFFTDLHILYGSKEKSFQTTEETIKEGENLHYKITENTKESPKLTLKLLYDDYIREEIIVLIALQFNSFFNQVALETMATPLSQKLLNWGEIENSIMYCLAGVEVVIVFMLVRFLSKKLQDRVMLLFGCAILTIANCWLSYVVPHSTPETPQRNIAFFAIGIILDMLALPFLVVCTISLYSKLTKKETQGLSQGIRRSVVGISCIIAPLWAGSTIDKPYLMFGVMIGLLAMALLMLSISFRKLKTKTDRKLNDLDNREQSCTIQAEKDEERQPLLS